VQKGYLKLFVVSDRTRPLPAQVKVTLMNFDGATLKSFTQDVTVAPLTSRSYFDLRVPELLDGTDGKNAVVYAELLVNGKPVSAHDNFFAPFKELTFSKPTITTEVTRIRGGFSVKLTADKFAKAVYLAVLDHDGFFSDNYFNLVPGKEVTVDFRSARPLTLEQFKERLQIRSVFDAFQ
jgi:beta-mannosidase